MHDVSWVCQELLSFGSYPVSVTSSDSMLLFCSIYCGVSCGFIAPHCSCKQQNPSFHSSTDYACSQCGGAATWLIVLIRHNETRTDQVQHLFFSALAVAPCAAHVATLRKTMGPVSQMSYSPSASNRTSMHRRYSPSSMSPSSRLTTCGRCSRFKPPSKVSRSLYPLVTVKRSYGFASRKWQMTSVRNTLKTRTRRCRRIMR
ncbi:hypothetical protein BV25DRAFT_1190975 [Artomyces pyxidatus]|uniref:Uncharacterized protein n=1 Tax=Artomyces pyxidatus TaxID=48021 RepID=A0ACB8SS76_9AGAM|nr:hypothetical protein BV25DRAFT_1190975 [Artomyces pyxidatus]